VSGALTLDQASSHEGAEQSALSRLLPALLLTARLLVAGIFVFAGVAKVGSPGAFADAVRSFHILPPALVLPYALVVPWLELLIGAYLLIGFMTRLAALGAAVLLASFIAALLASLFTGNIYHSCGCFGSAAQGNQILALLSGGNTVGWWDVIRDVILLTLCGLVAVLGAGWLAVDGLIRTRRSGSLQH
jgi:putative oxidoreductase